MVENTRSIQIPEFTDKSNPAKRQKLSFKCLFKMKINDLLSLEYNSLTDNFNYKNEDLSLVMCGGKIADIFRDDFIFSFDLDDGTGTIGCFHKFKYDHEAAMKTIMELPTTVQFLQTTLLGNETRPLENDTIFNSTNDDSMVKKFENETSDDFRSILSWFKEEVVGKQKPRNVGDLIHVVGHLIQNDIGIRKINVIDFRIVFNEEDHQDLGREIDFLNQCVY